MRFTEIFANNSLGITILYVSINPLFIKSLCQLWCHLVGTRPCRSLSLALRSLLPGTGGRASGGAVLRCCTLGLKCAWISEGAKSGLCAALQRAPKAGGASGWRGDEELFCVRVRHRLI